MNTAGGQCTEETKIEEAKKATLVSELAAGRADDKHQHLSNSGCGSARVGSRPTLLSTKSFPPYSQRIGGLGDDGDLGGELRLESVAASLGHDEVTREDGHGVDRGTIRRESLHGPRVKWRARMMERLQIGRERERRDEVRGRERGSEGEGKHWRGESFISEVVRDGEENEKRESSAVSTMEGEIPNGKNGESEDLVGLREGPSAQHHASPHPVLCKPLHSSSSSSSSISSISLSSVESEEVFSEEEDVSSKRKTLRKCHSWRSYVTMMHWSLRCQGPWVQLGGHQGNFHLSEGGEVLKLYSEVEAKCLDSLMGDLLRPFVPQYYGMVTRGEHRYIRLEDLLSGLRRPAIMDCKMGVRTYQEEELTRARTKAILRSDMYQKMVKIDFSAPSAEEHTQKGVTKWRYLQWRDTTTSTSTLGFRIEGIMMEDGSVKRDFRKILTSAQVTELLLFFTRSQLDILKAYHSRLLALTDALKNSSFFRTHEVIGSSLLFVHDHSNKANVWMIDFGKTTPVPNRGELRHNVQWTEGSREDGYLIGLTSISTSLSQAISVASWQQEGSSGQENNVK